MTRFFGISGVSVNKSPGSVWATQPLRSEAANRQAAAPGSLRNRTRGVASPPPVGAYGPAVFDLLYERT